jgi:hypothetical protein
MATSAEQKFRVLSQVVAVANSARPLERRLKEAVDAIAAGLEVDLCAVLLLGQAGGGLRVAAINDPALLRAPETCAELPLRAPLRGPPGRGP